MNMGLKGSKTEQNLKDAFAGESQANRRYLYFANKADIEGQNDVVPPPKVKPDTRTDTSSSSRPLATPPPGCRSARAGKT
jgi:hypothetical protein